MNDQQRYLAGLDFYIEDRGGVPVLVYKQGGCRPATATEWTLWQQYAEVRPCGFKHGNLLLDDEKEGEK